MNLKEKILKGATWSILEGWGRRVFTFVVFFLLARLLTPEDFGLIALATAFVSLITIFNNQGFSVAIVQRKDLDAEHLNTAFWSNICLAVSFVAITIICSEFIADFYQEPQLRLVINCLSFVFLINALKEVQLGILQRQFDFRTLSIRSLIVTFIGGSVGIISALCGLGVWSLVLQQLIGELLGTVVLWQASEWRPSLSFSFTKLKELLSFSINLLGIASLNFVTSNVDNLLIGYFLGSVALGYYALAYRVYDLLFQLSFNTISSVVFSTLTSLQAEIKQLRIVFYKVIKLISLSVLPVSLCVSLFAPEVVSFVFGEQWLEAIPVLRILSIAVIIQSLYKFQMQLSIALGKPDWSLKIDFLQSIISVIAFFIAVRWGIIAIAYSFVISIILVFPLTLFQVNRLIKIDFKTYFNQYSSSLTGATIMTFIVIIAKKNLGLSLTVYGELILYGILSAIIYSTTILIIDPNILARLTRTIKSSFAKF